MENLRQNSEYIKFWLKKYNPVLLFPLFIFGIYKPIKNHKKEILFLGTWFFGFFFLYMNYTYFTNRFMLQILSPYIILASFGAYYIQKSIKKFSRGLLVLFICLLFISNSLALYFIYLPESEILNEHQIYFKEEQFLKDVKDEVRDCYIIAASPFFVNFVMNEKSINLGRLDYIKILVESGKCVFFYENDFCFHSQKENCERIHSEFNTTLIKTVENRWYSVSLYEVN